MTPQLNVGALKQADYVLSACGRIQPPPGRRWVDLPYCLTYQLQLSQALTISDGTNGILFQSIAGVGVTVTISIPNDTGTPSNPLAVTVAGDTITVQLATSGGGAITSTVAQVIAAIQGNAQANQLVRVVQVASGAATMTPGAGSVIQGNSSGIGTTASRVENKSTTAFICRGVSISGSSIPFRIWWPSGRNLQQQISSANFAQSGAGLRTLQPEVTIQPAEKITIEATGNAGQVTTFFFWGVLRFLLKPDGGEPQPYVPDISRAPRIPSTQNQNVMAPEWRLGDQCTPETPDGYEDEPFTLYSSPIANPVAGTTPNNAVTIPADCDFFVVRNIQYNSVKDAGVLSGSAALQIRTPAGFSLTSGDYLPSDWTGPIFPLLGLRAGGRIIIDVADVDATGTGNITTTVQFDGVKRRKLN